MKGARAGIAVLAGLVLVGSCALFAGGPVGGSDVAQAASRSPMTFRYPIAADPEHLNPFRSTTVATRRIINNVYEGLVTFDPKTSQVVPELAERWEISPDGKVYTFHLRKGVRFQAAPGVTYKDREVKARDWIWSFKMFLSGDTAVSEHPEYLEAVKGAKAFTEGKAKDVEGLRALDDYTLQITLEAPNHRFLYDLVNAYVVPQEAYEQLGAQFSNHPVGTGPFVFKEWRRDDHITLVKNPDYWQKGYPKLDVLTFINVPDPNTQVFQYRQGELDVLLDAPPGQLAAVKSEFAGEYHELPGLNVRYLGFKWTAGPFKDNRALRLAFNYAINKDELWNVLMEGARYPADKGVLPPSMPAADVEGYPFDPERAKQLLAEAGYPGGKGLPEITYYYYASSATEPTHAAIQEMLRRVGIRIKLKSEDNTTYWSHIGEDEVALFLSGWSADFEDPSEVFNFLFYKGRDDTKYDNPEVDKLIDQATATTDPAKRNALYKKIHEMILADVPWVPLSYSKVFYWVKPYVHDFYVASAGTYRTPMKYVWLER
ncbi:ABC transporter substrate-binding protein [Carboxydochorda subterranea]|uniref:ABC transporter substrate-binding protein n=1 Tax=Carboxydichorda subterranea TaxID=3109565 RepID=A0ABZ1BWY6_9FIRM|nr:ABC transporter substrate-binding protein [Limnochorda sp. L945t]WRP17041.1 ABC transporter substrate-binding protein [Limnochorda sp. L945t]